MTPEQKQIILDCWDYCDTHDKSTEFMLAYMSDMSGVDFDEVVEYVTSDEAEQDREIFYSL